MAWSSRDRQISAVVLGMVVALVAALLAAFAPAGVRAVRRREQPGDPAACRHGDLQAHRRLLLHDRVGAGLQACRAASRHHPAGAGIRRHGQRVRRAVERSAERVDLGAGHPVLRRRLVHVLLRLAEHRAVRPTAVLDPQHVREPDDLRVERTAAVQHRVGVVPARRRPRSSTDGVRYFVWAQDSPSTNYNSHMYIARMNGATGITGPAVEIARPTHAWEMEGVAGVVEGPSPLREERQGVHRVLRLRDGRPLQAGPAVRARHGQPAEHLVLDQEPDPGVPDGQRRLRPGPRQLHRGRGQPDRHPRLPRP